MKNTLSVCQSKTCYSVAGFASFGFCANANLIVITPKEQAGAESIVYSAGTFTQSSSFTKTDFRYQTVQEQTITILGIVFHNLASQKLRKSTIKTYVVHTTEITHSGFVR